jgi:hypothetical protein
MAVKRRKTKRKKPAQLERAAEYHLQRKYGIGKVERAELLESQGNKCAICQTTEPGKRGFFVDHDHVTNRVRGLLCLRCNTLIGYFERNPEYLAAVTTYLGIY